MKTRRISIHTGRQSTDTSAKMARMWEFSHKYDKVLTTQIHKLQSLTFFKQMLKNRTSHKRYKENPSWNLKLKNKVSTINSLYALNSRMEGVRELEEKSTEIVHF